MKPVAFIGPSYDLRSNAAGVQRTINMFPVKVESGNDVHSWVLRDVPGLVLFSALGSEIRGGIDCNGRVFAISGNTLYEVASNGAGTSRGTLSSSTGLVEMTYNATQLVFADSTKAYTLTLGTNTFASVGLTNVGRIAFIDQYILYVSTDTQQFGWSAVADGSTFDPLDFASAEGSPDNLVTLIADRRELILFGRNSVEVWASTGDEYVFTRNNGVFIDEGAVSVYTPQKIGGGVYWVTQSEKGRGSVMEMTGYQPRKISTKFIEEKLTGVTLSAATAFAYTMEGSAFYCINVPSLDTTLCYDASTGQWHERAEYSAGTYSKSRVVCAFFGHGYNLVGDTSGNLYKLDPTVYTNNGDTLAKERISPNTESPSRKLITFGDFEVVCDKASAGTVQMRFSNNGGNTWGSWRNASTGQASDYKRRVIWHLCGAAYDRVWDVRVTDAIPFNPTYAVAT